MGPIRVRTYRDDSAEESARLFEADADEAARAGFYPTSQTWQGTSLTVTYQRRELSTTDPVREPDRSTARGALIPSVAIALGGALVGLGSLLPWVRIGAVSATGMSGDGLITLAIGIALVLVGIAGATDPVRASSLRFLGVIGGVVATALAAFHIADLSSVSLSIADTRIDGQVGEGLYVVVVGGVTAIMGAFATPGIPAPGRPRFGLPHARDDLRDLPTLFRIRPALAVPFALLVVAFVLELVRQGGGLPEGALGDIALLYIQLTLPPTALFVFILGGLLAPRAAWLVGALLGTLDAALITLLVLINPQEQLEGSGSGEVVQGLVPLWVIAIAVGIVTAAIARSIAGHIAWRLRMPSSTIVTAW